MTKEYIDREALINIFNAKAEMAMGTPKSVFHSVVKMVEMLPAADVVEVVRCKDCKDYRQNPYNKEGEELLCMCWGDWIPTEPDDFCSQGERKEQG